MNRFSIRFLLGLIFISNISFSQTRNSISVSWNDNVKAKLISKEVSLLNFDGAEYDQEYFDMPFYTDRIALNNIPENVQINIENQVFLPVSSKNLKGISIPLNLQTEINVKYSIASEKKKSFLEYSLLPLRKNPISGAIEKLISFSIDFELKGNRKSLLGSSSIVANSVLSSGTWVKIGVKEDGIYKLTFSELIEMGISNPAQVKLFGSSIGQLSYNNVDPYTDDLDELAIQRENDYILFYAKGPLRWKYSSDDNMFVHALHKYSTLKYYFLSSDIGDGKEISSLSPVTAIPTHQVNTFDDYIYHEEEDTNLIKSGRIWYGEEFGVLDNIEFNFSFDNLISSEPVKLKSSVIARSTESSAFYVYNNSNIVSTLSGITPVVVHPDATYAFGVSGVSEFYSTVDNISLDVNYQKPNSSSKGWLNYLCLNARRELTMSGNQMHFRNQNSVGSGNVAEYNLANASPSIRVWDVTDILNVKTISYSLSGSNLAFSLESDELHEFIAMNAESFLTPETNEIIENQNIHGKPQPDYIIVAPDIFMEYAEELAEIHRSEDGMNVLVVSNDQVYNEFSSGTPDVTAIKNMIRMFYNRAISDAELPKYLLLFGDGSYDNFNNEDGILTYQSSNSLNPINSFCTDDFFGFLDENEGGDTGALDISIGRFTVSTENQASQAIDKVRNYISSSTFGDWRNVVCFIADDSDNEYSNSHMNTAEEISTFLHQEFPILNFDKIYLDAFPQVYTASGERYPDAELAIKNRLDKGALLINYTGHGNELGLTHEQVIGVNDILNWNNADRLPLFMTATCEFSRFDDYGRTSGGELVFLNPNGGGIALSTTTRPVYPSSLSYNFYSNFYKKENGEFHSIGDLLRLAKNITGSTTNVNKKKFVILGDPALKLAYPEYKVVTSTVNGAPINESSDTLKALSLVTIEGFVENDGNIMTDFSGFVYPTVYDKEKVLQTLGNEGNTPMPYLSQKNILYKGKSSIVNGTFSFSFVVPKDISYDFGNGKLSYYASSDMVDAAGNNEQIIIGGSSDDLSPDGFGPEIRLFMNDEDFISGGITDENPKIMAFVTDSSGINTVGNGIGHDIIAVLDGNIGTTYNMNDHYEADIDSYQSGVIEYPLSQVEKGLHTLKLKIWDVCNNSSSDSLDFIVAESAEMAIEHLFNYPNPFIQSTDFYFEHNQTNTDFDVIIQIFTISGRIIKTLYSSGFEDGYRIGPIHWDGLDDFGNKLGRGVYIYKVSMKTSDGEVVEKLEKLVILK